MGGLRSPRGVVSDPLPSWGPCRDCGVPGPVSLYRDGSSAETVYLCDECRGAISLDAFACGEEDSLSPVFEA